MGFFDKFKQHKDNGPDDNKKKLKKVVPTEGGEAPCRPEHPAEPYEPRKVVNPNSPIPFNIFIFGEDGVGKIYTTFKDNYFIHNKLNRYYSLKFEQEKQEPNTNDKVLKAVFQTGAIVKRKFFKSVVRAMVSLDEGFFEEILAFFEEMKVDTSVIAVAFEGDWNGYNILTGERAVYADLENICV